MDQILTCTPDTSSAPPAAGVCDYAACSRPAEAAADGWVFCRRHRDEHDLIMAGEDIPDLPRAELPISHGTYGGHRAHQRRGENPCQECWAAYRQQTRKSNDRHADRWHHRAAS